MELVPDGAIKKSHTEIVAEIRDIDEFELYCISLISDSPWDPSTLAEMNIEWLRGLLVSNNMAPKGERSED